MKKKSIIIWMFFLTSLTLFIISFNVSAGDIYVDDDNDPGWYDATHVKTIQEGNDNATDGDTVYVYNGTYHENVVVDKNLSFIGNSTTGVTVDADGVDSCFVLDNILSFNITGIKFYDSKMMSGLTDAYGGIVVKGNLTYLNVSFCHFYYTPDGIVSHKDKATSGDAIFNANVSNNTFEGVDNTVYIFLKGLYNFSFDDNYIVDSVNYFSILMDEYVYDKGINITFNNNSGVNSDLYAQFFSVDNLQIINNNFSDTYFTDEIGFELIGVNNTTMCNNILESDNDVYIFIDGGSTPSTSTDNLTSDNNTFVSHSNILFDVDSGTNLTISNNSIFFQNSGSENGFNLIPDGTGNVDIYIHNNSIWTNSINSNMILINADSSGFDQLSLFIDNNSLGNASKAMNLNCNNSIIKNNTIEDCNYGIYAYNPSVDRIKDLNIYNNNINNSSVGIFYRWGYNTSIYNNSISNCSIEGIELDSVNNSYVYNNTLFDNVLGIFIDTSYEIDIYDNFVHNNTDEGIYFHISNDSIIYNNTIENNDCGIYTTYSPDLNIHNNSFIDNYISIHIRFDSTNATITDNNISSFDIASTHTGISFFDTNEGNITHNTIENMEVIGFDFYEVNEVNIHNNTIQNISLGDGLTFEKSSYINITNNTINNGSASYMCGIELDGIPDTNHNFTIRNNTITDFDNGIYISYSDDNLIYNNYFDNTNNSGDWGERNIWNISKTSGTNIIGGPFLGGNYWSNYSGTDNDGDGLGDTPYPITSTYDYLPLFYRLPMFDNISADPNPGYETNIFFFNVSIEDPDTEILSQIRCILTFEGNAYSNNSMTWIEGNNLTGANYSYNVTLNTIGIFGYKFQAYDGLNWNETTIEYLWVQGLPGHFNAELFLCFYDATSGIGIDEKKFKIYLSDDTTINETDRIYNTHQYTYTGSIFYYKITDYFDNKIYPLNNDYETVTIDKLYKYLDIPITWYDLAIKNMNETIMFFSMNNGSRYYNITLFPQDTYHLYVIPGCYNITKNYYYVNNGSYYKNETDTITIYNSTFYIASGYTAFVHISIYNTNEGLGLPDETLKIYIDSVRQIGMTHWTFINKTINLTIKDYYNLTMYENNFTLNNTYTFLDLGLTFHSWLFGNMNEKYYMLSFLKDGGSRWFERGIVPYGQREFLLPSGNYTMRIYDANYTEIHNKSYVVNRSMVYVINGTNLSTIIEGQSVITGQLLELDELIDYALMPDNIIWSSNPPIMFSIFDRIGQMLGNNIWEVCPALDVISTTRNSTYTNNTTSYPLVPTNGTTANGTITIMKDVLYLSGNSSVNWVNITFTDNNTLMQNTTYIPNKINLFGQNLTIIASDNISILRETTFSKITKFNWNIYNSTTNPGYIPDRAGYHRTVLNVKNNLNVPIYDVYVFAGFSDLTTPDLNTIRIEDLENGILIERGERYKTTGDGVEFMIDGGVNSSSNRSFKVEYYKDIAHTYYYEDAQIEIKGFEEEKTLNGYDDFFNYKEFTWINPSNLAFRGSLRVKLGFKVDLDKDSVKVYDFDEKLLIDDEHIIVGDEFIWISGNAIGSVPSGGGRTFGIYFKELIYPGTNLMEFHLATPIGIFLGITFTPFLIIFLLSLIPIATGSFLMIRKMKYKHSYATMIGISTCTIFVFYMLQAQGV